MAYCGEASDIDKLAEQANIQLQRELVSLNLIPSPDSTTSGLA
jgi:hypothetical protein